MKHYDIPFNLAMREEKKFLTENDEQIVINSYYSLIEVAVFSQNFLMAEDLLDIEEILEPINVRVVEDKNVYEYKTVPFEDMFYIEEKHLMFLIEMGIINSEHNFRVLDEDTGEEISVDPFSYFLRNGFDQCFIKLHRISKAQDVTFSLKNTSNRSVSVHEYSADAFAQVSVPPSQ